MKIRPAKSSDKQEILSFCTGTFDWGDYIDKVWDIWYAGKDGRLFVVEDAGNRIAISHVALCRKNRLAWLQGVRVHPDHRRSKVATELLDSMLAYAGRHGARRASAIVSVENVPSQRMMKKNGFAVVSKWVYYSTGQKLVQQKTGARLATPADLDRIWEYLQQSQIYRLSAGTYVKEWHWYPLDRAALRKLVREKRVALTGDVDGLAVINPDGYWNRPTVLQIVYLDSQSTKSLRDLLALATNMYSGGDYERMHVVCHDSSILTSMLAKFKKEESELFLLYSKEFTQRKREP
ncbi:GNAT family N-acetyltransferase [Candidatus Nitrososphaera sp. FF02]|uniref:GNAT family N-acetyltransferase n=1 Tax=Candidatus Nitrososphaera sp. FF02 TaxID=3398226 RepID=UPI0039E75B3C